VIVTNDSVVKIIDFGLAKLIGSKGITKTPSTMGTVAYMSPEQTQGETVDHRTDIWSLGVILYEMLTGQLPFKGEYDQAVVYSILNEEPKPLTDIRPDLPMALAQVVEKALQKDRHARYQHVDEMLADLRQLKGEVTPRAITPTSKKRARTLALSGFILAAAILALLGYLLWPQPQQEIAERIPVAVADFVNETKEDELDGLSGMLITALEQSRRLAVLTRSRMFDVLKQMGKENIDHVGEDLGKEICQRTRVKTLVVPSIRKFGKLYTIDLKILDLQKNQYLFTTNETGEGHESIPGLIDKLSMKTRAGMEERTSDIRATRVKVSDVTTINLEAYRHYFLGEQLVNKMQFAEAQEEFKKAIALDSTFGLAYFQLAYATAWSLGNEHLGIEPIQKAMTLIERIPEKERYLVRAESARLGTGDGEAYAEALLILKEMERLYPDGKEMLFRIGDYSYHSGQYATASEYFEKVLAIDPTFSRAYEHLTWTYGDMKSFKNALVSAQRYVSAVGSPESYRLLAGAYFRLGEVATGLKTLKQAQTLFPDRDEIGDASVDFYIRLEEYDNSEAELKRLLAKYQTDEAKRLYHLKLAHFYPYIGKYREGLRYFDKLLESYAQAHDTAGVVDIQIFKAYYFFWGWNDTGQARMELKKIFPFVNKLLYVYRQNLPVLYTYLGDFVQAEELARNKYKLVEICLPVFTHLQRKT